MPAIGKILIIFASVLILARIRIHLGLALACGAIVLNLWAGLPIPQTLSNFGAALVSSEMWLIVATMAMIIEIGRFMAEKQNADEIVSATQRWGGRHGRTAMLMSLPAIIGLIPMPGGALFSAPFVQHAAGDKEGEGQAAWKSAVNYWFRHVWEYWWPLYPGVVIAMAIFDMDAWKFVATQFLYTPVALLAGWFFLVRPHVSQLSGSPGVIQGSNRRALFLLEPIAVAIIFLFVLPPFLDLYFPQIPGIAKHVRKIFALFVGIVMAVALIAEDQLRRRRASANNNTGDGPRTRLGLFSTLFTKQSLNVQYSVIGVLIFKSMLETSGLLPIAGSELTESRISPVLVIALLPLLAGFVTGIALGFAGASFPLVVGIMNTQGSGMTPSATLVLAYGFAYIGMMLSPVHLCLLVTKDYFRSTVSAVYRMILPSILVLLTYCIAAYTTLHILGW